jgi:hypothetical protein
MKDIESAGQAASKGKAQLLEGPPGVIAFHTHGRKLIRQTASTCKTQYQYEK